ncbi:MerR family transcriptional regulator [Vagococcus fluvialis]|uniref:MerR family transcriptional regulator n=1 Tax=Vagococcus fluvialis TaxID=2738 RepID=UPI003B214A4D
MLELKFVNEDEIIERLYKKLEEHIDKIVVSNHIEAPLNQTQIAKFLTVSTDTILSYEKLGMPYGHIGKRKFYDRKMCMDWQTSSKIDELI